MKKLLLATSLSSILLLGACGNNESDTKESKQEQKQLTVEQEEKIQKEELKKVIKQLDVVANDDEIEQKDIDKLNKDIKSFENKTENLEQIDIAISDPIINLAKTYSVMTEDYLTLQEFEDNNPDLTETFELVQGDMAYHMLLTINTLTNDYEELEAEYKNKMLGKELNTVVTDLFEESFELQDIADGLGVMAIEYSEDPTDEQLKQLPNTDSYRNVLTKYGSIDEADVSKNEYNSMVKDYNELAPEFLHYKEATEMVSADENLSMSDIRNGIVGADTDKEVSDYEDDMEDEDTEDTDTELDEDEDEDEDDEELEWVENEDGELELKGSL